LQSQSAIDAFEANYKPSMRWIYASQ
jgi:hypothetical protein